MRRLNKENFTTTAEVADWYNHKFKEMGGSWSVPPEELNALLDQMGLPAVSNHSTHVLELGFGDGKLLEEIVKRGARASGIDVSDEAMRLAWARRRRLDSNAASLYSIYKTPMEELTQVFEGRSFDYVISYGSAEHALDIPQAMRQMFAVLKPGGKFLLYAPNEEWIHEDQPLETTMSGEEWTSILQQVGLQVDSIEKVGDNNIIVGSRPVHHEGHRA